MNWTKALVLSAIFMGSSPASAEPEITLDLGKGTLSEELVLRAVDIFRSNCAHLNAYWNDLERIEVEVKNSDLASSRLAKGWKAYFAIAAKVPDYPRRIPQYDGRVGVIAGHTLHYNVGGGSDPGFIAYKRVSMLLCGMPVIQSDGGSFKAVPDLSIIEYQ